MAKNFFGDFYELIIERELDFFWAYFLSLNNELDKEEKRLKSEWDKLEKQIIREADDGYEDYLIDRAEEVEKHFEIFYSSFVITSFSYLEHTLNQICRKFSEKEKSEIKLKDLAGKGILRVKLFMEKICKFDLPSESLWHELQVMGLIRNRLAHIGGENPEQEIINYAQKSNRIKIDENSSTKKIVITADYCKFCCAIIRKYLMNLIEKNRNHKSSLFY